ncbi:MAG: WD40 repeat domain-containing protein [Pseudomonadota bacterium]
MARQLRARPELLGVMLHDLAARQRCKVLLFVDQLEETYTMVADPAVRDAFVRALCGVADHPSSPVRAVFTVRDDFLGRLGGGPEVTAALARVFVLRRPSKEGLEEVLTRPLASVGYAFDDPLLASEMVESVIMAGDHRALPEGGLAAGSTPDGGAARARSRPLVGEPSCLPLLQFAGQMLWERRDKNRRLLLRAAFEAMGGVAGSLAEHADGVLAGMTPPQVELARQLLLRLVTSAGTRKIMSVAAAVAGLGSGVEEVLDRLIKARLLTVRRSADAGRRQLGEDKGSSSGEAVLEVVHESLLSTWRRLARWIEESHDELALLAEIGQAADLWEKRGRRDDEVWQGDALADARRKLARLSTSIPEQVAQFLRAGLCKEQRQRRRRRLFLAGTMAVLVAVAVVSVLRERYAQSQKKLAERERAEAQMQRARAKEGEAEAQREGASAALSRGHLVEARARLRGSLETQDSLLGRALWWRIHRDPLEWTVNLGGILYDTAFSPDGRSIAAASHDRLVFIIDVDTTEIRPLRGENVTVMAVAYSPHGRYLASGYLDGKMSIWDLDTGKSRVIGGHNDLVARIAFSPDGTLLASASIDRTVCIWTVPAGNLERVLQMAGVVVTVAFSPDSKLVAVGGQDKKVRLLEVSSGRERLLIAGHSAAVLDVAFSPDGTLLASASTDSSIRLWRTDSGELLGNWTGHTGAVRVLSFSPDGMLLASASEDKSIRVWSVADGTTVRTLVGHNGRVKGVAFSPDGVRVASASYDRTVRLWRIGSTSHAPHAPHVDGPDIASVNLGQGHGSASWGLGFSPDGKSIVSSGLDETLRLWDVATGMEERSFLGHQGEVSTASFSPDGRLLASGGIDKQVRLWDASSGQLLRLLPGYDKWVRDVAFSASGSTVVYGGADNTIRVADAVTGVETRRLVGHVNEVVGIATSPDDRRVASASYDRTLRVWDLATGKTVRTLSIGAKQARVVFSPDGRLLYANGYDGAVRRWDLGNGSDRVLFQWPRLLGGCLSIDPTGRQLAVPVESQMLLMDPDSGVARTLGRSHGVINRTAFSPDGRLVAATTADGTVWVWQVDRLMPHWRAPVLLRSPPRLFTHRGWVWFDGSRSVAPVPAIPAWERAVEDRGILGSTGAGDQVLCLHAAGEQLEQWDLVTDELVDSEKVPGIVDVQAIAGGGCASLAGGVVRIHRRGGTVILDSTEASAMTATASATALASHDGQLMIAAGRKIVVIDLSADAADAAGATKASYSVDAGVSAVGRVGEWLVLGYEQGQIELLSARPGIARPHHTFKGAPSAAVTRLVAGPAGTLVGGYANGTVILWTMADGAVLESAKLHGPIRHLLFAGDKLMAATEVGQYLVWDLSAFKQPYCELMRQVWRSIPVVWEGGLPVSRRSMADHRCAGETR